MKIIKPRIIFDRSAFHGDRFDKLIRSPLKDMAIQRHISIYHTPILIEETARMYLKEKNREALRNQLPFILEICVDRWFKDRMEVWVSELAFDRSANESVWLADVERRRLEKAIRDLAFKNEIATDEFESIIADIKDARVKAVNIRTTSLKMRDDLSAKLKELGKKRENIDQSAEQYVANLIDSVGKEIIVKHLPVQNVQEIAEKWAKAKDRYPYYTLFVRGFLYMSFFAMSEPSEPVDINAPTDISHITYMHGCDVLVTNDKFMKKAFEFMYRGQPKECLTSEELIQKLGHMNSRPSET